MTRVLVVDDEPRIVSFVARALEAEGFEVDGAFDGVRGFDLARTGRYELVVLDLLLPGLDGQSVLGRLIEERPDQRVLVLSALSDVEEKVRCLELGASDYLAKPFALAELIARVRARLRQAASGPEERYLRIGDVELDRVRRVAVTGSGPVALTQRESSSSSTSCSETETRAPDRGCSRTSGGSPSTRGATSSTCAWAGCERGSGPRSIETVRGVGYRFNAP